MRRTHHHNGGQVAPAQTGLLPWSRFRASAPAVIISLIAVTALVCLIWTTLVSGHAAVSLMAVDAPVREVAESVEPESTSSPAPRESASALHQPVQEHIAAEAAQAESMENPAVQVSRGDEDAPAEFDGRPLREAGEMTMVVTAYSPDEQSCGEWADGWTASGYSVWTNGMKLVAADTDLLPFGTVVSIPGYNDGEPVQVLDRGGAIKGNRLDVLYPTHNRALQWGVQELTVTVWEYAD